MKLSNLTLIANPVAYVKVFSLESFGTVTFTHTYIHTHIHTHIHTYMQSVSDPYDGEGGGGPSYLVVPPKQRSSMGSIRCECHVKVVDKTAKRAKTKLVLASIIALAFMAGEVVGKMLI
jgi:hypothetical protein